MKRSSSADVRASLAPGLSAQSDAEAAACFPPPGQREPQDRPTCLVPAVLLLTSETADMFGVVGRYSLTAPDHHGAKCQRRISLTKTFRSVKGMKTKKTHQLMP